MIIGLQLAKAMPKVLGSTERMDAPANCSQVVQLPKSIAGAHLSPSRGERRCNLYRTVTVLIGIFFIAVLSGAAQSPNTAHSVPSTVREVIEALRAGDYSRALALSQALTQTSLSDPRAWTLEGIALGDVNRNQESLRAFEHALKLRPNYVPALEAAAQLEYRTQNPEAQQLLEKLVQLNPSDETAHAMLAALAFRRKDCVAAVAHFERSAPVISDNPPALTEFGDCLVRLLRPKDAVAIFERLLALDSGNPNLRYDLGLVEYKALRNADAIRTLLPLTEGPSSSAAALNLLAAAYEANQQTPQAVAALRRAMALAPRVADNYLDLATISLEHGSFKVGVDVIDAGLQMLPDSAPLYLERGVLLVQMGRFAQASEDFEKAARLNPAQNLTTVALGISLLQENQLARSLEVVKQRLARSPDDPVLNYLLAEILIRKGVHPGTPQFLEAVSAAERAVHYKPDFALADDVLGELYLRSGQTSRAARASRLALKANPNDQSAIYHLIICLRKEGDQKDLPPLVQKLRQVTTAAQKQETDRNRFKLVEMNPATQAP
jgi:tetratricopeptide (TPR) repeat protein